MATASVASSRVIESFRKGIPCHQDKTCIQVPAAVLYVLLHQAFHKYCGSNPQSKLTFNQYISEMANIQAQFVYWTLVPDLELTLLLFVRSVQCLLQLLPWFFALDHVNSRWGSVHIRDLIMLERHTPIAIVGWRLLLQEKQGRLFCH
ncbi:hypothetical protein PoB_006330200 [Plakobranchus ocellatus]|uniref:Uncharacterized protein n=1 Tax=Plakobranchus ocellatus TaxID=259542 RepID=A0AAV4CY15_9GAST|nr:hypothetical protein PoB_006330200 [Plakobranchus ocellatus]